jgi:hypothetical protein
LCLYLLAACGETVTPTPTPAPPEFKVDTVLLDILLQFRLNGAEGALKYARERGILDSSDNVLFVLVLSSENNTGQVSEKLNQMGGTVRATYRTYLSASVPLDTLVSYATNDKKKENFFEELSAFKGVREIRLNPPPGTSEF